MIKTEYTVSEWKDRENYYISTLENLYIPESPTVKDILNLTSKLDKLYTEASFELSMLKRKESRIALDLKNAEAKIFNIVKQEQLVSTGTKITEKEANGLVKEFLEKNYIQGYTSDIYSLLKAIMNRLIFAESVVRIIAEKKASIISATAMLKIENSFSGAKEREYN